MDSTALPTRWIRSLVVTASLALVVGALYMARTILIPVVLSVLLSFILSPLVVWLQRWHLRRVAAVLIVMILALLVVGGFSLAVLSQVESLAVDLPKHKKTIVAKINNLQEASKGSLLEVISNTFHDINKEVKQGKTKDGQEPKAEPIPVTVQQSNELGFLPSVAGSAAEILVDLVLVFVLVVFMLIRREDLRNRMIRLSGEGSITSMTKALDDATQRISRFLLAQLVINGCFGIAVAAGCYLIGIPYALLWGVLAGALRYLPYIGVWVAAVFPLALSFAVFPGWTETVLILVLFFALELVTGNVLEPLIFGQSIGVSEVALLISATFWAWLWGPIGLLMSAPLTACLVVLGRYIPQLEFFDVLLGDQPALPIEVTYYQRLLARDDDEAARLAEDYSTSNSPQALYDNVFLPALVLTAENLERSRLTREDAEYIQQATRELIEDLSTQAQKTAAEANGHAGQTPPAPAAPATPILVLGCPARDEADELVLQMLGQITDPAKCQLEVVSAKTLSAEVVHRVETEKPPVVCIASLPPRGLTHARYLCKRLRSRFPNLKILVLFPGRAGLQERTTERLRQAGADEVVHSLEECRSHLVPIVQVLSHSEEQRERATELVGSKAS